MRLSLHRREALRTNLWFVPACLVASSIVLFVITYALDRAAFRGTITLPGWINTGDADAARQILTAIAAAVITVVGLVFSIVIVALTLASTQFGPRMLRNFIRDRGTQATLGVFVATFVYCVLVLGSVGHGGPGRFVPQLSLSSALALVIVDSGVLIYFIHHIARSIQLPVVIADIAVDLQRAIDAHVARAEPDDGAAETVRQIARDGAPVYARMSGYLQFIEHRRLVAIAVAEGAVVQLLYRPGHFVSDGHPFASVVPASAASAFERELDRAHVTGSFRTLAQDLTFAIDQIVEIAIRALSPAVNDTFTAMTCIDWLGDGLSDITIRGLGTTVHRDAKGTIRVIEAPVPYERIVDRAFDKVRQAGRGMPAIAIRQLAMLARVMGVAKTDEQRRVLIEQADMIMRATEESIPERLDRDDVHRRYAAVVEAART